MSPMRCSAGGQRPPEFERCTSTGNASTFRTSSGMNMHSTVARSKVSKPRGARVPASKSASVGHFPRQEALRHSSHTVRAEQASRWSSRECDQRDDVRVHPSKCHRHIGSTHQRVEATGLRWWQRLPSARLHRRGHIDDHLKDLIRACFRDSDPGRHDHSDPRGE